MVSLLIDQLIALLRVFHLGLRRLHNLKLYIDDLRRVPDDTWTLARTNTEAIRFLATGQVTEVSCDHDICTPFSGELSDGVKRRLQIGQETFQPVAYYIAAMSPCCRPAKINFHTANVEAGLRMVALLKDAGIDSTYAIGSYNIEL